MFVRVCLFGTHTLLQYTCMMIMTRSTCSANTLTYSYTAPQAVACLFLGMCSSCISFFR
jgi:hypothetical protein